MNKKIIITLPAYNEEKNIGIVVSKIKKVIPTAQILVIDDGSKDYTAKIAKEAGATVVSFAANRGLVAAFKAAKKNALLMGADIILNMDADGQHRPEDIHLVLKPLLDNKADVVIGSRFKGKIKKKSLIKYVGNIMFSKLISSLTRQRITDAQSGFRAYTREVAEHLEIKTGHTYTQQMLIQAAYHKFKIIEVPIIENVRRYGTSKVVKNPFTFAYKAGNLLLSVLAIYHPIKFFGTSGFLLMLIGLIIGLIFSGRNVLSSLIIMIGFQFILFGVLFEIIKKNKS